MNKEVEFVWEIENVSKFEAEAHNSIDFDTSRESPVFFAAGIPWSLSMGTEIHDDHQEVFFGINCEHEENIVPWKCKITLSLVVKNQSPEEIIKHERTVRFDTNDQYWGRSSEFSRIFGADLGFVINDKMIIEARVIVNSMSGIRKSLELDFTSPGVGSDDIALIVEDQKLHYLSMHSPVFAAMFFNNFEEMGKTEIELPEISYMEFLELLYIIHPSNRQVTHYSVRFILTLADRFQMKYAADQAESFILATERLIQAEKLLLADQFKLELVKKLCLSQLISFERFKQLESTPQFHQLSAEMKSTLLNNVLEIIKDIDFERSDVVYY